MGSSGTNDSLLKTVLVAEDDADVLRLVSSVLKRVACSVITAHDGPSAIREADQHSGTIDLLVSDVLMPGMTGVEVVEQILKRRPHTKILLMTGWPAGAEVKRDGWSLLYKPFSPEVLKETVQSLIELAK